MLTLIALIVFFLTYASCIVIVLLIFYIKQPVLFRRVSRITLTSVALIVNLLGLLELLQVFHFFPGEISIVRLISAPFVSAAAVFSMGLLATKDRYSRTNTQKRKKTNQKLQENVDLYVKQNEIPKLTNSLFELDTSTAFRLINNLVKDPNKHDLLYGIIEIIESDDMAQRCLGWLRGLIHERLEDYWGKKGWEILNREGGREFTNWKIDVVEAQRVKKSFRLIRLFDVLIASILLLLLILIPILPIIAVCQLIYFGTQKSIFYVSHRAGLGGNNIRVLEFRTYRINSSNSKPEISRLGAILVMSGLDKAPMLLNVIKGEMSLVGPSPIHYSQFEYLRRSGKIAFNNLGIRQLVPPGMTGIAQMKSLQMKKPSMQKLIEWDQYYINNNSIPLYFSSLANSFKLFLFYFLPSLNYLFQNWKGKLPPAEQTPVSFPKKWINLVEDN
jgi:lipopolysaccharide/colanic/teichoic acid biosynthesis glycosyltransferase